MYARVAKRVRVRDLIRMNRSLVGITFLGARNPHCPQYPLIHEILVGIPGGTLYEEVLCVSDKGVHCS